MRAILVESSWLRRVLEVQTPEGNYEVEYNGRGFGYESVLVNGERIASKTGALWFVPLFEFLLGERLAAVEVRVWPWLTLRSFQLIVGGEVLYGEGVRVPLIPERTHLGPADPQPGPDLRREASDAIRPGDSLISGSDARPPRRGRGDTSPP